MLTLNATEVRKDFSEFIDSVVHEKPRIIKRSRDYVVAMNLELLKEILSIEKMVIVIQQESDGSITGVCDVLGLMTNAKTQEQVLKDLAREAVEYADDYYQDFAYWHAAPNRKHHLPYVFAILSQRPENVAKELFVLAPTSHYK
ncbi:MAG: hypothetical protein PHC86_06535 [Eubacteriales bacterium]|nr:hypothetical protein [Eubacteriales bacterium]